MKIDERLFMVKIFTNNDEVVIQYYSRKDSYCLNGFKDKFIHFT